jgi:hypothetical protein
MRTKKTNRGAAIGRVVTLILILGAVRALANDFYVTADGDDAHPGTAEQPFKTLQAASAVLEPGDTCRVGRGLYRETVRPARSGKFDKPIRYVVATGETVTVTGVDELAGVSSESNAVARTRTWGLDLEGRALVEVSGFVFQSGGINLTGASYCRVENCEVWAGGGGSGTNTPAEGLTPAAPREWGGAIRIGGKENEVVRCSVMGSEGHGIVFLPGSVNNRVVGAFVRDATNGYGIVIAGTAQTVRRATVTDCSEGAVLCSNLYNGRLLNSDLQRTSRNSERRPIVRIMGDGKGAIVAYNWIHDNASNGGDGILMEGPVENYLLHRNVIWGNPGSALRLRGPVQYCLIFNNTCARNGTALEREAASGTGGLKGLRLFNNLFAGTVWPGTGDKPGEGVLWENNYVGTAPGFVDESAGQFSLTAESPCIDAGQDEPELTDAYSGRSPDAGAYEFGRDYPVPGGRSKDDTSD